MPIPDRSSRELWSEAEDEQLRREILEVVERHPGRSAAAVMSRIKRFGDVPWWPLERPPGRPRTIRDDIQTSAK